MDAQSGIIIYYIASKDKNTRTHFRMIRFRMANDKALRKKAFDLDALKNLQDNLSFYRDGIIEAGILILS